MTDKDIGVMHKAMNNILVFASTLKEARSSINYNIDQILKNLDRYIKTAGKTEMNANDYDCSGLKTLYEQFHESVCKTGLNVQSETIGHLFLYQIVIFALILFYYGPILFGTVLMSYSQDDADSNLDESEDKLIDKKEGE